MNFWRNKKVLLTGGDGFLGKAVFQELIIHGVKSSKIIVPTLSEFDLRNFETCKYLTKNTDIVIHLAAKVGGILYNKKHPGSMMYDNLLMGLNIIESARINNVKKVVLLGTTCAYPENAPVPFQEEDLWNGYPAEVTAPYGIAKKTIHELAKGYKKEYGLNSIFLLPVNLYGPGDNFIKEDAHVIPALIQRFVKAVNLKLDEVVVWGSGNATREFLYVKDAAEGIILAAEKYDKIDPVNLGTGIETPIRDIVRIIAEITDYKGNILWDKLKPDGTPRRCMDISKAEKYFEFTARTNLIQGLKNTYNYYLNLIS